MKKSQKNISIYSPEIWNQKKSNKLKTIINPQNNKTIHTDKNFKVEELQPTDQATSYHS